MDKFETMISEEEIIQKVKELGAKISSDYEGESVVVIGVLTGAFIFTADLVREITVPVETIDFVSISSFEGDKSTGNFVFNLQTPFSKILSGLYHVSIIIGSIIGLRFVFS